MSRPQHLHQAAQFARDNRKVMPPSEVALWCLIRRRQLGVRFRRQVPIGPYIADFACLNPRIVIEVDGPDHDWKDEGDRTAFLEAAGFALIRINNETVAFDDGRLSDWLRDRVRAVRNGENLEE